MLDIYNKAYWDGIAPGSTITLKDKQAIEDSMEKGLGMKGADYIVKTVIKLNELNDLVQLYLFLLDDPEELIWIMVKIVDQELDFRVYFEHPQFEPGNRKDMIDQENFWLFMEPENLNNFQYDGLKFTDHIEIDEDAGDVLNYKEKEFKEMYFNCELLPVSSGVGNPIATIVEYQTNQTCENPELLLFELGEQDKSEGGLIRLMLGCTLRPTEIDVLEA